MDSKKKKEKKKEEMTSDYGDIKLHENGFYYKEIRLINKKNERTNSLFHNSSVLGTYKKQKDGKEKIK